MTKASQNDILTRVQDLGEEALQRLTGVPGGSRLVDMANQTKVRLDDMQKRIRGLEDLEQRVAKLEQQVAAQSATETAGTTAAAKTTPASKPTTPKKPPA